MNDLDLNATQKYVFKPRFLPFSSFFKRFFFLLLLLRRSEFSLLHFFCCFCQNLSSKVSSEQQLQQRQRPTESKHLQKLFWRLQTPQTASSCAPPPVQPLFCSAWKPGTANRRFLFNTLTRLQKRIYKKTKNVKSLRTQISQLNKKNNSYKTSLKAKLFVNLFFLF